VNATLLQVFLIQHRRVGRVRRQIERGISVTTVLLWLFDSPDDSPAAVENPEAIGSVDACEWALTAARGRERRTGRLVRSLRVF
jgi:hypothetical protein